MMQTTDERAELVEYLRSLDDEIARETDYQLLSDLQRDHDEAYKRLRSLEDEDDAMSEPETFVYRKGARSATFIVIARKLPEDYERDGNLRMAAFMRSNSVVTNVIAQRPRGDKHYLFYEVSREGRIWRTPGENISL